MSDDHSETDFTPPSIEEIAQLLPAYEILSFIAKGGMGAVYMANQRSLDRPVAIKILPRHFGEDAEFRASFETEAKSMAKLNHPNLIGIYDFGQVDGLLYIIMEMVQGNSLFHSAYGTTVEPTEAARIVSEICHGLANAHKHGILHRDIKPSNILLDPSASPKIGDFGLARPVGDHESDSCFGTPGYTAPEVIHHPEAVDESTDIYAVGIMLYELLTGRMPESNYVPAATLAHCNQQFDNIIRKAIHPTPALRYRTAQEMANALAPLTKKNTSASRLATPDVPVSATQNRSPITPTRPPKASNHFARNIFIIVILLGAIALAWEGLKKQRSERAEKEANDMLKKEEEQKNAKPSQKIGNQSPDDKKLEEAQATAAAHKTYAANRKSLSNLRNSLIKGERENLPTGTISHNGRARLYIAEKMTWREAQLFSESHGGHLAITPSAESLTELKTNIPKGQTVWLGAGISNDLKWRWIDGSKRTPVTEASAETPYLTVNYRGGISAEAADATHGFFIEWMEDGSTPANLLTRLTRCGDAIKAGMMKPPAGSVAYGDSHYLLVNYPTDWNTARKLAVVAGGNLAVPSSPKENKWLGDYIHNSLEADENCWIGGFQDQETSWQWITGEPWSFDQWSPGSPKKNIKQPNAIALSGSLAWGDFRADRKQNYFLIEWSPNHSDTPQEQVLPPNPDLDLKRDKCAELIRSIQKKYDPAYLSNIKKFESDLRGFEQRLPSNQRKAYASTLRKMRDYSNDNRIPEGISRRKMPAKLAKILDEHLEKQEGISQKLTAETDSLREKYRSYLTKAAAESKQKKQDTLASFEMEIKKTSPSGNEFIDYILKKAAQ